MNKDEKMIEEMAKVITDLEDCEHKVCRIECAMPMGCVYHDEDENECWCQYFDNEKKGCYSCKEYAIATELYNANCRIIGDDEMVVKRKGYTSHNNNAFRLGYSVGSEETAREILQEFMTKISSFEVAGLNIKSVDINIEFVKNLANKYGVELE